MEKTYRPYDPEQLFLLPPSLRDWLREDHLVYFLSEVVDQLDLSAITRVYEEDPRGYPPYHPRMMTKVLLYAYTIGVPSSRKIAQRCEEDVAFRVLTANNTPDFRTISTFRQRHLPALQALFLQVLRCCQQAGLVKLGILALDGTKLQANASKHKAMSYGRMQTEGARLEQEIRALVAHAERTDAAEDARYGGDRRGDELPAELARRETRLQTIRTAMAALEAEARAAPPEPTPLAPRRRGRPPKRPPGKRRARKSRIKRAVIMAEGPKVTPTDLELASPSAPYEGRGLRDARAALETDLIQQALARHNGNITRTAAALGVSRPTLHELITKHALAR